MEESKVKESERFVETPRGKIFVKSWLIGDEGETPIVMLHDSLGCIEMWSSFPQTLARKLNMPVIAYDRLGHGRSSVQTELYGPSFIQDEHEKGIIPILDALGLEKVILLGHSVGGTMCMVSASMLKERCLAVIPIASASFLEQATYEGVLAGKNRNQDGSLYEKLRPFHGEKAEWVFDSWIENWLSEAYSDWELRKIMEPLHIPLLSLHGDRDEYGTSAHADKLVALTGGPATQICLEGIGHIPHKEAPEVMANHISEFLEQIDK